MERGENESERERISITMISVPWVPLLPVLFYVPFRTWGLPISLRSHLEIKNGYFTILFE